MGFAEVRHYRFTLTWTLLNAFKDIQESIGVSTYRVTPELPTAIREELPTVEDLQEVVSKLRYEIEALKQENPVEL